MEIKIVSKNGVEWAEIRESVDLDCNIQIFVGKNGWLHKAEYSGETNKPEGKWWSQDVSGYNIRWSQNNSALMTFETLQEIMNSIEKAKKMLDITNA
jgi:hypothetical protein